MLFLRDMQRFCGKVMRYTEGLDQQQFLADELIVDAVLRLRWLPCRPVRAFAASAMLMSPTSCARGASERGPLVHRDRCVHGPGLGV